MTADRESFPARMDALPEATDFVSRFCADRSIDAQTTLRLVLVVEELFTNIVQHGYGTDCSGTLQLDLSRDQDAIHLVCEDAAPAFDPRAVLGRRPDDLDQPVESRGVGGLGAWLVGSLAVVAHFERTGGMNRLTLRLPLGDG